MTYSLLDLPPELVTLDDVPDELRGMYQEDADGLYIFTATARENIKKVASGIGELASQRDKETLRAELAFIETQVVGAILSAGCAGRLAAGAAAWFGQMNVIIKRDGILVVETGAGDVPLKDSVAEFMAGEGSIFLPSTKPSEQENHFLNQVRRFR